MRIVAWLATAAIFLPAMPSGASQLPLGISFRHNITVQEIWQGDLPFLCINNSAEQDRAVRVARWRSRQLPSQELLRWELPAGTVRCFEVGGLRSERLLEFTLTDGRRLGLLQAPGKSPTNGGDPAAYTSYLGVNGSCPTPGTWVEQSDLWFAAGETAHLTINTIPEADGELIEFPVNTEVSLPHLRLKSASSASLTVHQADWQISISTDQTAEPTIHKARIEFEAPQVAQPTMFLLSGRKRIEKDGWQCFLRGVMVRPVS